MAILVEITPLGEIPWMRVFFGVSALNFTLRAAIPLVLGALSGILCERSGIINIGIEGMMLAGAFAGFVAKSSTILLIFFSTYIYSKDVSTLLFSSEQTENDDFSKDGGKRACAR